MNSAVALFKADENALETLNKTVSPQGAWWSCSYAGAVIWKPRSQSMDAVFILSKTDMVLYSVSWPETTSLLHSSHRDECTVKKHACTKKTTFETSSERLMSHLDCFSKSVSWIFINLFQTLVSIFNSSLGKLII